MATTHRNPAKLPSGTAQDPFPNTHLPSEYLVYHGGDLSDAVDLGTLEPGVHDIHDTVSDPSVADGPSAGLAAECRCCRSASRR